MNRVVNVSSTANFKPAMGRLHFDLAKEDGQIVDDLPLFLMFDVVNLSSFYMYKRGENWR
jgi:hypothetical protein